MERKKYDKAVDDVFSKIEASDISSMASMKDGRTRVGYAQDMLRRAVDASSLCLFNGQPYYFGGRIYEPMEFAELGSVFYDVLRRCSLPYSDYCRMEGIIATCRRRVICKRLRPDASLMVFGNGVLDMRTRELKPFGAELCQTTCVDYAYDPSERTMLWDQFLTEVLPDRSLREVLQEFLGAVFVDRRSAKIENMMILKGSGSNGKSVVFDTVLGVLGRDSVSNFGLGSLLSGSERKKNIASINGKRLNYCSEIQAFEIKGSSDMLKALISGEPVDARPLYGANFTAYEIPLLMANCNAVPYMRDFSYGMKRRLVVVPFDVEIPKQRQDITLARQMSREYAAVFNWMMQGRDRFVSKECKLTLNHRLLEAIDRCQSESNSVFAFMYDMGYEPRSEIAVDAPPKWIRAAKLYNDYMKWCVDRNIVQENVTQFGRLLNEAGYCRRKMRESNSYAIFGKAMMGKVRGDASRRRAQERDDELMAAAVNMTEEQWKRVTDNLMHNKNRAERKARQQEELIENIRQTRLKTKEDARRRREQREQAVAEIEKGEEVDKQDGGVQDSLGGA